MVGRASTAESDEHCEFPQTESQKAPADAAAESVGPDLQCPPAPMPLPAPLSPLSSPVVPRTASGTSFEVKSAFEATLRTRDIVIKLTPLTTPGQPPAKAADPPVTRDQRLSVEFSSPSVRTRPSSVLAAVDTAREDNGPESSNLTSSFALPPPAAPSAASQESIAVTLPLPVQTPPLQVPVSPPEASPSDSVPPSKLSLNLRVEVPAVAAITPVAQSRPRRTVKTPTERYKDFVQSPAARPAAKADSSGGSTPSGRKPTPSNASGAATPPVPVSTPKRANGKDRQSQSPRWPTPSASSEASDSTFSAPSTPHTPSSSPSSGSQRRPNTHPDDRPSRRRKPNPSVRFTETEAPATPTLTRSNSPIGLSRATSLSSVASPATRRSSVPSTPDALITFSVSTPTVSSTKEAWVEKDIHTPQWRLLPAAPKQFFPSPSLQSFVSTPSSSSSNSLLSPSTPSASTLASSPSDDTELTDEGYYRRHFEVFERERRFFAEVIKKEEAERKARLRRRGSVASKASVGSFAKDSPRVAGTPSGPAACPSPLASPSAPADELSLSDPLPIGSPASRACSLSTLLLDSLSDAGSVGDDSDTASIQSCLSRHLPASCVELVFDMLKQGRASAPNDPTSTSQVCGSPVEQEGNSTVADSPPPSRPSCDDLALPLPAHPSDPEPDLELAAHSESAPSSSDAATLARSHSEGLSTSNGPAASPVPVLPIGDRSLSRVAYFNYFSALPLPVVPCALHPSSEVLASVQPGPAECTCVCPSCPSAPAGMLPPRRARSRKPTESSTNGVLGKKRPAAPAPPPSAPADPSTPSEKRVCLEAPAGHVCGRSTLARYLTLARQPFVQWSVPPSLICYAEDAQRLPYLATPAYGFEAKAVSSSTRSAEKRSLSPSKARGKGHPRADPNTAKRPRRPKAPPAAPITGASSGEHQPVKLKLSKALLTGRPSDAPSPSSGLPAPSPADKEKAAARLRLQMLQSMLARKTSALPSGPQVPQSSDPAPASLLPAGSSGKPVPSLAAAAAPPPPPPLQALLLAPASFSTGGSDSSGVGSGAGQAFLFLVSPFTAPAPSS